MVYIKIALCPDNTAKFFGPISDRINGVPLYL